MPLSLPHPFQCPCPLDLALPISVPPQVLNAGRVVEFDSPYALVQSPDTLLSRMVGQTGPFASRKLYQMAEDAHLRRRRKRGTGVPSNGPPVIVKDGLETAV